MCIVLEDTFESLYVTLYLVSSSNSNRGLETKIILHFLTKTYIVCSKDVLNIISFLFAFLHLKDMDYARANILVKNPLQQLRLIRVKYSYWHAIYEKVEILWLVISSGNSSKALLKRKKQLPPRFNTFFTELESIINWMLQNTNKNKCPS